MNISSTAGSFARSILIGGRWRTFLVLSAGLLVMAGCGRKTAPVAIDPRPVEVGIVTVTQQPAALTKELAGRTAAYRLAEVRARVDGIVQKRLFEEGAEVTEGQSLYQIDAATYEAALASAQAALARADANLKVAQQNQARQADLYAAKAISQQDYDNILALLRVGEADVAAANAAVKVAAINLSYTEVKSPLTGRIGRSAVTEGAYVQQSQATLLATVQQLDPIYVDMTESSVEVLRMQHSIARGQVENLEPGEVKATLILEDGRIYAEKGRLQFLDVTVNPTTGSVGLRAVFANPRRELLPGTYVRARLEGPVMPSAILVPQRAVTRNARGEPYVMKVGEGDKVEQHIIQAGQTVGDQWLVESGLSSGDRIIVEGLQKVRAGSTVKPVPASSAIAQP